MATILTGKVVSASGDKTIIVQVDTAKNHPVYKKKYTESSRFAAHDETNAANEGDTVSIEEVKPISKTKKFALKQVIEKSESEGGK